MKPSTLPLAAELATKDVLLVRCHLAKALEHLDECTRGFPTGGQVDSGTGGSSVERLAIAADENGPDRAETDLARLCKLMEVVEKPLHDLGALCREWATGTVGGVRNTAKADDDVWCPNCQTHRVATVRGHNRKHCDWCTDVKIAWGVLPNAELFRMRSYKQRLTEADYGRALGTTKRRDVA